LTLTVYGDSRSGNCLKVRWLLDRLGRAYDWLETDIMTGVTRMPDFLALNPAGQVPLVVLEDRRTLAQSNAILVHFGEGTDLIPADAYDRARMFEWLFWEQYSHEPYVAVARFRMAYEGLPREALEPRLVERGNAALDRMETALAPSSFLVGDTLTLADIALVAYTRVAHEGGFDLSGRPNLRAWIARVEQALPIR
jgi:glutathione S-transferase